MTKSRDILFSIIVPTYNRANMIGKAIESVLDQTYTNWELIIVDDGSTDNTRNIVSLYNDKRIKYFYQENSGRSSARNFGIDVTQGDYLSFLDDDDYYMTDFLKEFYIKISEKEYQTGIFMCDQTEKSFSGRFINLEKKIEYLDNPAKFILKNANNFQSFCTSKQILQKERFDERFELGEDFHLIMRIVLQYPFEYLPKSLCVYNNHEEMTMNKELNNLLFINLPYNRLDTLNDILNNYKKSLIRKNVLKDVLNRYNKIAYFYASTALRKKKIKYALKLMKDIKWGGTLYKVIYYKLSVFIRAFYYKF